MEYQQTRLAIEWRDASGSTGLTHIWCHSGLDATVVAGAAETLRPLLLGVSNAEIVGQSILFRGVESPRPTAPGPEIAGDAGMLIFDAVGGGYFYASIPSLKTDLLETAGCGAGVRIKLNSPPVAALSGAIQLLFCDPFGAAILGPKAGMLQRLWRGR